MEEGSTPWGGSRLVGVGHEESIFVRVSGSGPAVLLLHGFPETHLMWRDIAPVLAEEFTVVAADLRGYGSSGCPPSTDDHAPYSKRVMAAEMAAVMARLGVGRFAVVGHDRGGRVAYRLALDHPEVVERVAVLDIIPTLDAWERADDRLTLAFWPWSLLAQPAPLPEALLSAAPAAVIDDALNGWGTSSASFGPEVRRAYIEALSSRDHVAAICEEYRAAATIDRDHDARDRSAGRRITCPLLALWSAHGALGTWYGDAGGPLDIWRGWARDVRGRAVEGGHFFPEEHPTAVANELREFLTERR